MIALMTKQLSWLAFVIILLGLSNTTTQACSCGCAPLGNYGIGGPIITTPAYTLPQGKFVINTSLRYQNVNELTTRDYARINGVHAHSHDSEMQPGFAHRLPRPSVAFGEGRLVRRHSR